MAVAGVIVLVAGIAFASDLALTSGPQKASGASVRPAGGSGSGSGASGSVAKGTANTSNVPSASAKSGLIETALDPSMFAKGACMAFTPQGAANGETVFLDAGHGGIDPGGTGETENGSEVYESRVNLPIEMDAMRLLTSEGYRVVVSRTEQTTVLKLGPGDTDGSLLTVAGAHADIAARDICANKGHASLLVGIYMNSGGYDEAGSVTIYDAARSFSAENLRFAHQLQSDVLGKLNAQGYQIPTGGVRSDSQMGSTLSAAGAAYGHLILLGPAKAGYFTTPSQMPGALIEPLFLTDPFEASIAVSSKGQHLIAEGIAEAAGQYFAQLADAGTTAASSAQAKAESLGDEHVIGDHFTNG